jgi:hypothetical protein
LNPLWTFFIGEEMAENLPDKDPDVRKNTFAIKEFLKNSNAAMAVQSQATQAMSSLNSHMSEVLGPIQEVSDFAKSTVKNVGSFFKGIGSDLGLFQGEDSDVQDDQLDESKEQTTLLTKILDVFRKDKKEKFKEALAKKDKKPLGIFGAIAMALGIAIGAVVGVIVLPFTLLLKLPFIKKLQIFLKPFKNFLTNLGLMFVKVPILGPLVKGISVGFKRILWPLQLLLSFIDFIQGFMATEGSLFDKIKGGLLVAIIEFLELPIRALGWFLEKLGVKDATAKVLQVAKVIFGGILDVLLSPFKLASDLFGELHFGELIEVLGKTWDAVSGFFGGLWTTVDEKLTAAYDTIVEKLGIKDLMKPIEDMVNFLGKWFSDLWQKVKDKLNPKKWFEGVGKSLSKAFGLDKIKGKADFSTKAIVSKVKMHAAKPVSEIDIAGGELSLAKERSLKRAAEKMKTADAGQKEFLKKLTHAVTAGQADVGKILVATATNKEGESKEPPSIHDNFGIVMESVV